MKKSVYAVVGTVLCTLIMTNEIVFAQSKAPKQPPPEQRPASEDGDPGAENRAPGASASPDCRTVQSARPKSFFSRTPGRIQKHNVLTVVSCTNLDSVPRTVTCQFFLGFGNAQEGGDASVTLGADETGECATRDPDPTAIFVVNADAATDDFEGKGRICSDTTRLGCHAHLACSGTGLEAIFCLY